MYNDKGKITRDGAIQVIQSGGTVLHSGKLYTNVTALPSEADFAKGDAGAEAVARERLQKQIADAQQQLKSLSAKDAEKADK